MRSIAVFLIGTFFFCVAMAVASPGAAAFPTVRENHEVECFPQDDGLMSCLQEAYPEKGFAAIFLECPATASSVLDCPKCAIIFTDDDTPNEIDFANYPLCTGCTVCENTVAYDCSNLREDSCVIQDCDGTCTPSGSNNASPTIPAPTSSSPEPTSSSTSAPTNATMAPPSPTEATIPPTPESSTEETLTPTPESSPERTTPPTPQSTTEPTTPPTPESSPKPTTPQTPEPTNPSTSPTTSLNEPLEYEPADFSLKHFRAEGIKMKLDNVGPLDTVSASLWQDVTGPYIAIEMKETIGPALVEAVEVFVTISSQDPPFVSRRTLLGKSKRLLRRLQPVEELTFDADISIRSDVDANSVNHYLMETFNKDEYRAVLRESGDHAFANVGNVSVTPPTSITRVEDPDNDKPGTGIIVGSVAASIAALGLVAFLLARRANQKTRVSPHLGIGKDSVADIYTEEYIEKGTKSSRLERPFPRWLSRHLGTIMEATPDKDEGTQESHSTIPFPDPSNVDEESLFVSSLTDVPINALGDADEESVGATTFSSISTGCSYPAATWSLPAVSMADSQVDSTRNCYWTKDDEISVTEFEIKAPAGSLGMVLETTDGGAPKVHEIKSYGPLAGRVRVGDRLVAVDGKNVTSWCAAAVSRLIASKKYNPVRELIFARPKEKHVHV